MGFSENILKPQSFPLLLGPCVIESEELVLETAYRIKEIFANLSSRKITVNRNGIIHEQKLTEGCVLVFKASYDKANRSSINGFRGPGIKRGLEILAKVKSELGLPVVSDVHEVSQMEAAAEVLDIIQIPAFLCRQTDLISAAARTGKVLNIKKGQFLSPAEIGNIRDKCLEAGNDKVFICERGNSFGYNNLVVDMRMFAQAAQMGIRTIFDATHSCQLPGAGGDKSLGNSEFAPILARAAIAAGATGIFAETHPQPSKALSDGPNMIPLEQLETALESMLQVRALNLNTLTKSLS